LTRLFSRPCHPPPLLFLFLCYSPHFFFFLPARTRSRVILILGFPFRLLCSRRPHLDNLHTLAFRPPVPYPFPPHQVLCLLYDCSACQLLASYIFVVTMVAFLPVSLDRDLRFAVLSHKAVLTLRGNSADVGIWSNFLEVVTYRSPPASPHHCFLLFQVRRCPKEPVLILSRKIVFSLASPTLAS